MSDTAPNSQPLHAEVLVLGGGPGGYTAAFRAADLGKRVVLVEKDPMLGGVCLNIGCIPSKALLHAAKVIHEAAAMGIHGVVFDPPQIRLEQLRSWKESVVGTLTQGLAQLAKQRNVTVLQGSGKFVTARSVQIDSGVGAQTVQFDQAIIAVGSQPARLPGLPYDDPRLIDSTGALALREVPAQLLVIGGGIIGLEMATVYHALGSQITVVELQDQLIPGCDKDLVRPLQQWLERQYDATIYLQSKVARMDTESQGLRAYFSGGTAPESAVYDQVLVAVGRNPNGGLIGAEAAGILVDERGFIPVDQHQRTNVAHIFAIGDVVGPPMLAHKATHEGKVAAEVIAGLPSAFQALTIPSVAYTDPEIAWMGVTETEARARGMEFEKAAFPWAASGRSLGLGRKEGVTKLLRDKNTQRIIGAGMVGPNAGDLIAEAVLALEMGADTADLALTIHPHPTLSETLFFAAEMLEGSITDLFLRKR